MIVRFLLALLFVLLAGPGWAACPSSPFAAASDVKLEGDAVMIVVHATSTHDARFATKRGVDEAIRFARRERIPVIYLQDDTPEQFYFAEDCNPDYRVFSQGGEIAFDVAPAHLYVVGGHLELCLSATLHDVLYRWSKMAPRSLAVTYFMDAIYSNGKVIDRADPFYGDFARFMDIVTYGRPGGEHWPKLSLLETMGIIQREDHELEYIKQILPRWDRTFPPEYRVEVRMNDSVNKILRPAPGWHPPTLLFHFVDTAIGYSPVPLPRAK